LEIVIFCHPAFMRSQSMPRFANMLKTSYEKRGHQVQVWSPQPFFHRLLRSSRGAKWAGYIDQYLIFPWWVRKALKKTSQETLFVFCDQALGPWVPLVQHRPHVVHVHDLLALRSALGHIPENPTSITGNVYQRYIRRGFRRARHFISISEKTRSDLHEFGGVLPQTSEVVLNGLNFPYAPMSSDESEQALRKASLPVSDKGMLLHVGGGQWYKNLAGVLLLYAHYAEQESEPLPLWCISPSPSASIQRVLDRIPAKGRVHFFQGLDNTALQATYSRAHALIFPSLAEGFGWPLIEAQASGCQVLTTDEPPMNEVAGDAAHYLLRLQSDEDPDSWAKKGSAILKALLSQSAAQRAERTERGLLWSRRFDPERTIDGYLEVYSRVLHRSSKCTNVAVEFAKENSF
jgi:glycosyltransferase involved in cell wall biosynthesis